MKTVNTQVELEKQNLDIMIDSMNRILDKSTKRNTVSELKQSRNVIPYYVAELNKQLVIYLNDILGGKAKIHSVPAKVLTLIPTHIIAHYTVKTVVNFVGNKKVQANTVESLIAQQLGNEYKLNKMKMEHRDIHKRFTEYIRTSGHRGFRLNKLTYDLIAKYYKELNDHGWDKAFIQVSQLALYLLEDCLPMVNGEKSPKLFHTGTITNNLNSSKRVIYPSDWFMNWLRQTTLEGYMLTNYHTALIEEPKDWTGLSTGGFHTKRFKNKLIKTTVEDWEYDFNEMNKTVQAVNTLQKTPWEINKDILDVMQYAVVNNLGLGKLPRPTEVVRSEYPFPNMSRKDMNEEQLKLVRAWQAHHARLFDEFHSESSKYLSVLRSMNEAKRFVQYSKIFFAYQVDFRGRIYPIASNLHPQGSEYIKSLLRFNEGKVISDSLSEKFFFAHGANTFGKDKLSMDEKYLWVMENKQAIINTASNPYDNDFWEQADEPWLFLAFAFEFKGYMENPKTFKSKLPIALDGSCNGLQHLSAMLKDEVGGRSVNLTQNVKKADIYADVAEVATTLLGGHENKELAQKILKFGISRSTTKRSVMIVPYSGTIRACREYIKMELTERNAQKFFGEDFGQALNLLTECVWSAIGMVVLKGREVMNWFRHATGVVCSVKGGKNNTICWTTPNGFRVVQKRVKSTEEQLQTSLGENIRLTFSYKKDTERIDTQGHRTSISPNFIHALDACCLQNTVNKCKELGITNFAMIHDSYGTHAGDSALMSKVLREEFVRVYQENNVLQNWINEQAESIRDQFEPLPSEGNLDLNEILKSEFFFS